MKLAPCIERRSKQALRAPRARTQRGELLLEALISMLITLVLGLGLAYSSGRVAQQQRYSQTLGQAVVDIRAELNSTAWGVDLACPAAGPATSGAMSIAGENLTVTGAACARNGVQVSLAGAAPNPQVVNSVVTAVDLSTSSDAQSKSALGGDGVVSVRMGL